MVRSATLRASSRPLEVAAAIVRSRRGQRVPDQLDRLAHQVGEARGKARMLEQLDGASQRRQVVRRHVVGFNLDGGRRGNNLSGSPSINA